MRHPCSWLILCALSPLISALPTSQVLAAGTQADDRLTVHVSKSAAHQHDFVAHLVHHLRKQAIAAILRLELFTIGSGNHFVFVAADRRVDDDQHRTAAALLRLWTRLPTMERTDAIINDATADAAPLFAGHFEDGRLTEAIFKNIEERLRGEPKLYGEYVALKNGTSTSGAGHRLFFDVNDRNEELPEAAIDAWTTQPTLKRCFVNKLFVQQCAARRSLQWSAEQLEHFKTAKALVELAQNDCCAETVQRIYDETVDEMVDGFSVSAHPYESNSRLFKNYDHGAQRIDRTTPKLFRRLVDKCRAYPKVYEKLRQTVRKMDVYKDDISTVDREGDYLINLFPL